MTVDDDREESKRNEKNGKVELGLRFFLPLPGL